jgi:hypothetical protein
VTGVMSTLKMAGIAVAGIAAGILFALLVVSGAGAGVVFITLAIWLGVVAAVSLYLRFSRLAAVLREAKRLGLSFSRKDPFGILALDFHPFVRFGKLPGTQGVANVVWGHRNGREIRTFEYWRPGDEELIRYSCAMMRIPGEWPSLLVRRQVAFDAARRAAGMRGIAFELETFNRVFEVRATDRGWASAVVDQRMMSWLLESEAALGFELRNGWFLTWMPRLPPDELERVIRTVEGFHERLPRAVWSLYGRADEAR